MSRLVLCKDSVAAMPYYVEDVSINLYSFEEICYFIKENLDLAEPAFMNSDFIGWVDSELKQPLLAQKLELYRGRKNLPLFVETIFRSCSYLTAQEIHKLCLSLAEFQNKNSAECGKIRADRLLKNGRYVLAINEYKRIIGMDIFTAQDAVFQGKIWNNMGTAYGRLFRYKEAAECFEQSYKLNLSSDVAGEYWAALYMADGKDEVTKRMESHDIDEATVNEFISSMESQEGISDNRIDEISELRNTGDIPQFQQRAEQLIESWKEDYRKNCVFI